MRLASMLILVASASTASADTRMTCQMTGSFVEAKDNFSFEAELIQGSGGADSFKGAYVNAAKVPVKVHGVADKGTWKIEVAYLDPKRGTSTKELVGKGSNTGGQLAVTGTWRAKVPGSPLFTGGSFRLDGKCR